MVERPQEMIERVAAVILAEAAPRCYDDRCCCIGDGERFECLTGSTPNEVARAAIAAMREPTEAMVDAATESITGPGTGPDHDYDDDMRRGYAAMISAALGETP